MNDLFIGGGGLDGILFIGSLEYLHENNLLDLKRFYGCSIGALIGILYISGYTPMEILSMVMKLDTKTLIKYDILNLKTNKAILNNDLLDNLISNIPEYSNITIEEFSQKYGVDINIYATNLTTSEYTNFNNKLFPKIKLKDAIMASMTVPFIFKPVEINGQQYIDGCVKNIIGSPPPEICILGYSIILKNSTKSYVGEVIKNMIHYSLPNSLYIIECEGGFGGSVDILKSDELLTPSFIFNLYKSGINSAREQINHVDTTIWE